MSARRSQPRQRPDSAPAPTGEGPDTTQLVTTLLRGLDVLEAFRRGDRSLGNAELAERTGLAKPTVSRLAYTLTERGYLRYDPRSRTYALGAGASALGAIALATNDVRATALPLMRELATGSRFNVGLGVRDGLQMIYTDAVEGDALVNLRLAAGSRIPLATSAMGRACLAALPDAERSALLDELRHRYDDEWPGIRRAVDRAVDDLAGSGFCCSFGDWQRDIHGVAAPIRTTTGDASYVVNLGGPAYALSEAELRNELGPRLAGLARAVEARL